MVHRHGIQLVRDTIIVISSKVGLYGKDTCQLFSTHPTNQSFGSTLGVETSVGPKEKTIIWQIPSEILYFVIEQIISSKKIASKTRLQVDI